MLVFILASSSVIKRSI